MPTPAKVHWVVCDDYAAGPYTPERAARERDARDADTGRGACTLPHRLAVEGFRPATTAELTTARRTHQDAALAANPFTGAGEDEFAAALADRADTIMRAPLGTSDGELTVAQTGWTREAGDRADAAAETGSTAWVAALGAYERVTLTSDGRPVETGTWCRCQPEPDPAGWVRYERWTAAGNQDAHGFACPSCRHLVQSG